MKASRSRGLRAGVSVRADRRSWAVAVATLAVVLCYGLVLWMQVLHTAFGATERDEPPPFLHWLRDSTLALALVAAGVAAGLALARRLGKLVTLGAAASAGGPAAVVAVAAAASIALALGSPAHAQLFGASEHLAQGAEQGISPIVHVIGDALLAFPVSLLLTTALAWFGLGARRAATARRPESQPADSHGLPALSSGGSDLGLTLTRREVVKLGTAGGITLLFPLAAVRAATAGSPPVTPFRDTLFIPPVAKSSAGADPLYPGQTADFYSISMLVGSVALLSGSPTRFWGYKDDAQSQGPTLPGPTIMVTSGRTAVVTFRNGLIGERDRDGELTDGVIHLHGSHSPPTSDGFPTDFPGGDGFAPFASLIHQDHSREYRYPNRLGRPDQAVGLPLNAEAGKPLWYHDHLMDRTGEHIYRGLAGAYIIHDPREDPLNLPKDHFDVPLFLADRRFDAGNQLVFRPGDENAGVLGDRFLVNGRVQPFFGVEARRYRFRIYNVSNRRWYKLALDSGQPFTQIGTEAGLLPAPVNRATMLIAPAERIDAVIDFAGLRGKSVTLKTIASDLPEASVTAPLVRFDVANVSVVDDSTVPAVLRSFEPYPAATQERRFVFGDSGLWTIDEREFDPRVPIATPVVGTSEIWTLQNDGGDWVHPIHTHDVPFRILQHSGPPSAWELGEKETVALGPDQSARVQLWFRDFTGPYVFHCHNTEHEDMRMMARVDVLPR